MVTYYHRSGSLVERIFAFKSSDSGLSQMDAVASIKY